VFRDKKRFLTFVENLFHSIKQSLKTDSYVKQNTENPFPHSLQLIGENKKKLTTCTTSAA